MKGWEFKKKWRATPDNPAGTPYFLLAMITVSDGTTNRGGPAIPSRTQLRRCKYLNNLIADHILLGGVVKGLEGRGGSGGVACVCACGAPVSARNNSARVVSDFGFMAPLIFGC